MGEIAYKKNMRARNLSIRIDRESNVRVTVPGWCSFQKAEQFVIDKYGWIIKKKGQIESRNDGEYLWLPGSRISMLSSNIEIVQGGNNHFSTDMKGRDYILNVPSGLIANSSEYRNGLKEIVADIGFLEAKRMLPGLMDGFSEEVQLPFGRLNVKRMKTRWGSCSPKNNISLSSGLAFLDPDLVEYVCLHELTHTIHRNHSSAFWDALGTLLPDYKMRRKKLRDAAIIA
ncbi:MAG: M48 family metallopeptidase [Bacteroidales bacterium]|nr:M48 family metallopeptidase [Bacteroidales bacterium]